VLATHTRVIFRLPSCETAFRPPHWLVTCAVAAFPPAVPYPLLGENTLVLSDLLVIAPDEDGTPCLMCRSAAAPGMDVRRCLRNSCMIRQFCC
jgi:hypothetical protein